MISPLASNRGLPAVSMDALGIQDREVLPLSTLRRGVGPNCLRWCSVCPRERIHDEDCLGTARGTLRSFVWKRRHPTDYSCGYLMTALRWELRCLVQCQVTILMKPTALGIQVRGLK